MRRIDLELAWQRQQLVMNAVEQLAGALLHAAWQVRPPDGADEQRVAGQHEPRVGAAAQVGDDEAHALRRVPGRVQHPHTGVAELDLLSIVQGLEVHVDLGRRVKADLSERRRHDRLPRRSARPAAADLSLIHISEPTRPY